MNTYNVILVSLYAVILVTAGTNLFQVWKESKRLKEVGQTPLMGRNISVVVLAFFAEMGTVFGVVHFFQLLEVPINSWTVVVMFLTGYLLRNIGAYLSAWALWSVFVRIGKSKMQKELKDEQEETLL